VLPEYLSFGYVSEERTLFRNIRRLLPGHRLTVQLEGDRPRLHIEQYWDIPEPPASAPALDESEWIADMRRRPKKPFGCA
jgi:asparagine synthase (glutamine-hydrolysing)